MRIIRRIFQIAFITLLVAGIPYLVYLLWVSLEPPAKKPVQGIPDRSALIIQVNNPLGLLGELTRNNLIWKEFLRYPGIKPIQEQLLLIDSMSRFSPDIREILKDSPLTITLSLHSRASFDPLFLLPVPHSLDGGSFASFIETHFPGKVTILQSPYGRTQIYRIHFANRRNTLYVSMWEGVCIFSFADALVKRAIDQLSLNTPVSVMRGYTTVASTTGKKVDANIYVNFPYLSLALWKGVNETYNKGLVKFARYADWSGLDLYLKKDELLLNGYTIASDSAMQTLALMSEQIPLPLTMVNILPASCQAYLIYSLMRYPDHFARWQGRLQRAVFSADAIDLFQELDARYDTITRLFLDPWIGMQAGRCWLSPLPGSNDLVPVTILQSANPDSARKSLLALSHITGKKTDSTVYGGGTVYRTGLSEALNIWLSPLFDAAELSHFTIMGDYICFGDKEVLKRFLDAGVLLGRLPESKEYQEISDNISDRANISFYCNSGDLLDKLPEVLTADYLPLFVPLLDSLKKFQSVVLQLSAEEKMFYTSMLLRFNPNRSETGPLVWQTSLDTLVSGSPQVVLSGTDDQHAILITDTLHTLYKLDRTGAIEWKQELYGRVLGRYHEVMLTGNDSLFYLFNTEHHLCLIRSDGFLAERFPMKFPLKATGGLTLVSPTILKADRSSGKRERIKGAGGAAEPNYICSGTREEFQVVIPFRSSKVYSFDLNGALTEGWVPPEEGEVLVMDGFKVKRVRPEKGFIHSPNSKFYINQTNSKAPWLTTDINGHVAYLKEDGRVSRVSFNTFSPDHRFVYEDILGNGTPEFIFFDQNTLYYYDRFFKLIYFYTFRHDVSPSILVKRVNGKVYIGFTSRSGNEIFIFDRQGYVEVESGVKGTTPFDIGMLEGSGWMNLVIGGGGMVKVFRLAP